MWKDSRTVWRAEGAASQLRKALPEGGTEFPQGEERMNQEILQAFGSDPSSATCYHFPPSPAPSL